MNAGPGRNLQFLVQAPHNENQPSQTGASIGHKIISGNITNVQSFPQNMAENEILRPTATRIAIEARAVITPVLIVQSVIIFKVVSVLTESGKHKGT